MRRESFVRHVIVIAVATAAVVLATSSASAQSEVEALKAEVDRLKTEVEGLKSELRLIREVILQRLAQPGQPTTPAPRPRVVARVSVAGNPTLGKNDAAVTLVEFSDYQCPFCRRFFDNTLPALKKEYIETGKMRYVFRDFPLDSIHQQARKAAEAAHCAGEQGKYWEMHDKLFQNQQAHQSDHLKAYGERLNLDVKGFAECLGKGKYASKVQKNYDEGATAGVRGTPAFFIGKTRGDDTIEGLLISGARSLNDFRREIDRLLEAR
jgi:protein-disulfide isomerase